MLLSWRLMSLIRGLLPAMQHGARVLLECGVDNASQPPGCCCHQMVAHNSKQDQVCPEG